MQLSCYRLPYLFVILDLFVRAKRNKIFSFINSYYKKFKAIKNSIYLIQSVSTNMFKT